MYIFPPKQTKPDSNTLRWLWNPQHTLDSAPPYSSQISALSHATSSQPPSEESRTSFPHPSEKSSVSYISRQPERWKITGVKSRAGIFLTQLNRNVNFLSVAFVLNVICTRWDLFLTWSALLEWWAWISDKIISLYYINPLYFGCCECFSRREGEHQRRSDESPPRVSCRG